MNTLRAGRDDDASAIMALIARCWSDYPGVRFLVDDEMPELRALASHYDRLGGAVFVSTLPDHEAIDGMVTARPCGDGAWEIGRLYVHPDRHGPGGPARDLLTHAERFALARGGATLSLWSDTRFTRAHRFYEKHSYVRRNPMRALGDASNTLEFAYHKPIGDCRVERVGVAGAASALRHLAALLGECVDGGAAVSFLPPLPLEAGLAAFQRVANDVAAGRRALILAWSDGRIAGSVQLDLATPPNQPHRADLQKLLVAPWARNRGLGRALMLAAVQAARDEGRSLLVLDTREHDHGEALYRSLGWVEAGRIPGYALSADGSPHATVLFYKRT